MSFTPNNLGFPVLPPDPSLISPDLALDAVLAPVDDPIDDPEPEPLGRGWLFDFNTGQFLSNGSSPARCFEEDQLSMWIEKTLNTAREAHPIYTDTYGLDDPFEPVGMELSQEQLSDYQNRIADALLVHDRIESVEDFTFAQDPDDDALYVSFTVIMVQGGLDLDPEPLRFSTVLPT